MPGVAYIEEACMSQELLDRIFEEVPPVRSNEEESKLMGDIITRFQEEQDKLLENNKNGRQSSERS